MPDSTESGSPAGVRKAPAQVRTFVDTEGIRWQVTERPFADYDRRRGHSLIFSSDGAVRRVREFPADWFSLSDEELLALSWKP